MPPVYGRPMTTGLCWDIEDYLWLIYLLQVLSLWYPITAGMSWHTMERHIIISRLNKCYLRKEG